jgi:hypothetical protein
MKQPHGLVFYPFVASWFAKSRQLQALDLGFIKQIFIGAWVLDTATADMLHQKLPHANLHQVQNNSMWYFFISFAQFFRFMQ